MFLTLTGLFAVNTLFSQSDSLILAHRKAITFSFSGLNISGGIAGRYWIDNQDCLRLGLNGSFSSSEGKSQLPDFDSYNLNSQSKRISLNASFARNLAVVDNLVPYLGASVGFTYAFQKYDRVYFDHTSSSKSLSNGINGSVLFGVEYWITRNISLSAEANISVAYYIETYSKELDLSSSNSALLLSLYL